MQPNNEPAFPGLDYIDQPGKKNPQGMTLLDYFAAKAMQGLIGRYSHESDISRIAYKIANAMLKAREA